MGKDILNSEIVKNSKLSKTEKERLDLPLTLEELDKSQKKSNLKSAPGSDGFSNLFIRKCWKYLRRPLLKYFETCIKKGKLTDSFKNACIKLIPKKGDKTKIKNWRPISLLSNLYKIISRAINIRLKSVENRICSRAQKGFNSRRYTQEVLINLWETISKCNFEGTNGFAISLDIAKAFDTLSHDFMEKTLIFFGFGNNMITMLKLIGENRTACIKLDGNKLSRSFKLERGRPQGDTPSPLTFNFALQILLFKLELDEDIVRINFKEKNRIKEPKIPPQHKCETNFETGKCECFADDTTLLIADDAVSIKKTITILEKFGILSGLNCNREKTVAMPIGNPNKNNIEVLKECGFIIRDNFDILGINLKSDLSNTDEIFLKIKNKIVGLVSFWERFKLSLPGRIMISKTFLIAQLNYVGCFLTPDPAMLETIQNLINGFVSKKLKVTADRTYASEHDGGLGLIRLDDFLRAQKCGWVIRAEKCVIDNWRAELYNQAPNNDITLLRKSDFNIERNPILFNLVDSYVYFYSKFTLTGNNILDAVIFENENFTFGDNRSKFDAFFFKDCAAPFFRKLTVRDCLLNDKIRSVDEFKSINIELSSAKWLQLSLCLAHCLNSLKKANINVKSQPIAKFFDKYIKGSKIIRKIMAPKPKTSTNDLQIIKTFSRLTECLPKSEIIVKNILGGWKNTRLSNDFREFLFLERNNALKLNGRLATFMGEVNPKCTFCKIANEETAPKESFRHLFLDCLHTQKLLNRLYVILEVDYNPQQYWYATKTTTTGNVFDFSLYIVFEGFRYIIWKYKLRRKIPNFKEVLRELTFMIEVFGGQGYKNLAFHNKDDILTRCKQALG